MMPLGKSTPKQLKMGLLHKALSEVMGLLYGCKCTCFGVCES